MLPILFRKQEKLNGPMKMRIYNNISKYMCGKSRKLTMKLLGDDA